MNQIAVRAIGLPPLATCVGHRIGRNLEVVVARFIVETEAVHGVEGTPQWAVRVVAEPGVHARPRIGVVRKVLAER